MFENLQGAVNYARFPLNRKNKIKYYVLTCIQISNYFEISQAEK